MQSLLDLYPKKREIYVIPIRSKYEVKLFVLVLCLVHYLLSNFFHPGMAGGKIDSPDRWGDFPPYHETFIFPFAFL
jgi:hypothetical protein